MPAVDYARDYCAIETRLRSAGVHVKADAELHELRLEHARDLYTIARTDLTGDLLADLRRLVAEVQAAVALDVAERVDSLGEA